jgi:uncharacterized protein
MVFLTYMILGGLAGTLAGLFGIGGGLIIVPALIFSFDLLDVSPLVATHLAVGTSLATIVFTSVSSVIGHHRQKAVVWSVFKPLALGLAVGAAAGVLTAGLLPGPLLRVIIGIFAVAIGCQLILALKPKPSRKMPGKNYLISVGGVVGWASAIFGIGGGSMTVPYLTWNNMKMQNAVGTSAACGLPIAVMGAATSIVEGWQEPGLPVWSFGFVYLPAMVGIALASVPFARLGAKLAHQLPADALKRSFSVLLFIVGGRFILQGLEVL